MIYVRFVDGIASTVLTSKEVFHSDDRGELLKEMQNGTLQNRNDWSSFEQVTKIAEELTSALGRVFLPTDAGPNSSPQFDVVEPPAVGDEVSYAFNGDYHPDGVVTKVNANYRFIWTSSGKKYVRRRLTGSWMNGGTWSLVSGHRDERNPSF